ncbi:MULTISPECIES: ParM/StbA family protein [unclassified Coleofasciculus]|uniref:ParM/StbA family protein n=1 Tax=unclassified Coleofasciculus TaxID=2692782 RepID=UPI001882B81B|nr:MULTISPECIES: ParM/StbA family protein [unclassified Coleofasciculus]MBE9128204.1 ParM/StbA family protein [Coleofasciculus sp. LEGE 07081]MBE9150954.1 ParM/StbA family protein [Coleofasciculus sp. LEGE 07092]
MQTAVLSIDAGNYDLKFWNGSGEPKAIRSVKFKLPRGRHALKANSLNPVIELDGDRYHFGFRAYDYRKQSHTTETEKAFEVLLNVLACVKPIGLEFKLHVHTSHPKPEVFEDEIQKQLIGSHPYGYNGQEAISHIESVSIEPEGLGAWRYAKSIGLIPSSGLTIVIDIGGGTWLSRLIDEEGEILDSSVSERGGAYSLAADLSFDSRLTNAINDQPDPGVIMDGFANGSHYYAEDPNATWKDWLDEYLDPWFKGIFGKVKTQYKPFLPRVRRFFVTGGSSHLIANKIKDIPLFAMSEQPRFDNVRGLLPVGKSSEVVAR